MAGGIATGFLHLGAMMPLGVVAIMMAISGPSMLLAWLKLRKRNLGPILDANGWAVNAKAKINVPFGASLTGVAALPAGAQRDLVDPFAEKKRPWGLYIVFVVLLLPALAWYLTLLLPALGLVVNIFGRFLFAIPVLLLLFWAWHLRKFGKFLLMVLVLLLLGLGWLLGVFDNFLPD